MNECVLLTGIIKHTDSGYAFKVSMFTPGDANKMKKKINQILSDEGYVVTVRKGYFDE